MTADYEPTGWSGIRISSSCKDSEVVIMLWYGWTGCGDKALIVVWLPDK